MGKFYLFIIILFLGGCSQKTALNYFEKDPQSANAIQYTKKTDLVYEKKIKALFFATYLNNINKKYEDKNADNFLVGIYLTKEKGSFIKNRYTINLNNKKPTNIKTIKNNSPILKEIPLKDLWAKYYIISFKSKQKVKKFALKLSNEKGHSVVLNFEK